jgi:calcineurin-like phosphoesterase family protein
MAAPLGSLMRIFRQGQTMLTEAPELSRGNLSWLHFGDLHFTSADEQNNHDFHMLVKHANAHLGGTIDFAVLPGDNAEDGTEAQFALIAHGIDPLAVPLEILPGDHDAKSGNLDLYRQWLEPELWRARSIGGYRCVFLNARDNGKPEGFGFGAEQLDWLSCELKTADEVGEPAVLFMHTYPSELGESAIGASLSNTVAGAVVVQAGYNVAFLTLAGFASAGFAIFLFAMPETKPQGAQDGPSIRLTNVQPAAAAR